MMGVITATVTLVCPTLFSKNPINNTLGKDAIKNIKIHSSVFSTLGLLSLLSLLSLGVDIFYTKECFYLFISTFTQRFTQSNSQILCVEGFKISSKIYSKNYLKLKIFKA